ncbi:MAG: magnetochrome domain-containing protein [Mariprofundus sp.]|nr:magnetochrome domain-containing protein [Mariprofundus sp.]
MSNAPLDDMELGDIKVRKSEFPEDCSIEMRRFFILIAAAAVLILIGAYWYTQYQSKGVSFRPFNSVLSGPTAQASNATSQLANWVMPAPVVSAKDVTVPPGVRIHPRPAGQQNMAPATVQAAAPNGLNQYSTNTLPMMQNGMQQVAAVPAMPAMQPQYQMNPQAMLVKGRFTNVIADMANSVVHIGVKTNGSINQNGVSGNRAGVRFANPVNPNPSMGQAGDLIGSGVIISRDGYIVTNYHVVRDAAEVQITVFEARGSRIYRADVIRMDETADLALLKITPSTALVVAPLGDSRRIRVGDDVIAIGSPFGLGQTVSKGIVSAVRKSMVIEGLRHEGLLQTDAAINQGNSGGPLINTKGEIIGINTAIYTPTGSFAGIGFAVPSNSVRMFVGAGVKLVAGAAGRNNLARTVAGTAVGNAGPPIRAGVPSPHRDGREKMSCATCHELISANGNSMAVNGFRLQTPTFRGELLPIAAQGMQAAPRISPKSTPPASHRDGRNQMNCASCHQFTGGGARPVAGLADTFGGLSGAFGSMMMQPVAAPAPQGGVAPVISPNATPPGSHNDGRNQMNCASCHQFTGGRTTAVAGMAGTFNRMQAVVAPAPQAAAPTIRANATPPGSHNDGRNQMNCASCHQIRPAGGGQPLATQMQAVGAGGNSKRVHALPGADVQIIDELIARRLNQPIGKGVFVTNVHPGSPAEQAGLVAGDILLKLDGRRIRSPESLARWVAKRSPGDQLELTVLHAGHKERVTLVIDNNDWRAVWRQQNQPVAARQPMSQQPAAAQPVVPKRKVPTEFTWFGIEIESFSPAKDVVRGAIVGDVTGGAAAAKAGIKSGDIIVEVNGLPIQNAAALDRAIRGASKNKDNMLRMMRRGREFYVFL